MKRTAILATLSCALLAPAIAGAHPQSASGGLLNGFAHPFLGLDHLLAMIALGAWAARMGARAAWAVPGAFVAAMALGGLLGAALPIAFVEPLVASTVLILGLLVVLDTRVRLGCGVSLAAGFALFHAAAHVAEAPALGSFAGYCAGFVLATALLHLLGVSAAKLARAEAVRFSGAPIALAGALMLVGRLG